MRLRTTISTILLYLDHRITTPRGARHQGALPSKRPPAPTLFLDRKVKQGAVGELGKARAQPHRRFPGAQHERHAVAGDLSAEFGQMELRGLYRPSRAESALSKRPSRKSHSRPMPSSGSKNRMLAPWDRGRETTVPNAPSQTRKPPPNVNQVLRLHLPLLGVEGCPLNIARKELLPHVSLRYKTLTIAARAFASNRNAGWNRPPVASSIQLDTAVPAPGSESPRARTPCTGAHTPPRSPLKATRRDRTTRPRSKLLHSPRMPSHPPEKGPSNRPRHPRPPTVLRTRGQSYLRRPGA